MIHKLPPERRRRGVTLAAHGCCCCCCCCLHSVGGLLGAVRGSVGTASPEGKRTVRTYWWTFLIVTVLGAALGFTQREGPGFAVIVLLLMLPAAQLCTSVFVLMLSAVLPEPLDLRTLGRITWKGFLWGLVGFLIMAVPLILSSYAR